MEHGQLINTTLCYLEKDGKYLMIHRTKKQNDCNKDKWIGIGGKFELGESPVDCVYREVLEETGIKMNKAEYRGLVTFVSYWDNKAAPDYELMHLFWSKDFSTANSDSLPACDEGDLEWIPKNKMNDLPHWKGDEIFLDLIDKKVPFFSLKLVYKNGELVESVLD